MTVNRCCFDLSKKERFVVPILFQSCASSSKAPPHQTCATHSPWAVYNISAACLYGIFYSS